MLPGLSGSLIAGSYLERTLGRSATSTTAGDVTLRRLHQWWRRTERLLGPAAPPRAVADAGALGLLEALDFEVQRFEPRGATFVGTAAAADGATVVVVSTTWGGDPDRAWRDAVRAGRAADARWALIFSGPRVRIADASRTWSRRALDAELAVALAHPRSAAALATLLAAIGRVEGTATMLDRLVAEGEAHGRTVCATLGNGVLEALTALLDGIDTAQPRRQRGVASDAAVFDHTVTLVYRLLFLLFAESRAMVPTWHHVYRDAYTIDALCRRALARPDARGLWRALQAIGRMAHAGCRAGDLVVTPFNGRLFAPHHATYSDNTRVPDGAVARAVVALSTRPGPRGRERIAYGDLGVEQLGAVYERTLEYETTRSDGRLQLAHTSHERKSSGSFYTPRAMTEFLVRRALHPLVAGRTSNEILELRVVDPAMGSGAFLVAACRYLAGAVERALVEEGRLRDPSAADRAGLRRQVAQRCLFGVDRNPMAVQLARLSLWLTTLSAGHPLTFLDHHLAVGDSLIGAWWTDLARGPRPLRPRSHRDASLPLFDAVGEALAMDVLPARRRLALDADDTPEAVRAKEQALGALGASGAPLARWKAAADFWCALWFWRGRPPSAGVCADVFASLLDGRAGALGAHHAAPIAAEARRIADGARFFHWELAFPEVFFDGEGGRRADAGFDAVIGNPPWDVIRADPRETTGGGAHRDDRTARLRFYRDAGAYRHQGRGHANSYQLFVERVLQLMRRGGRLALVTPSGLATDHGSAALRRALLDTCEVERLIGFDNRRAIFPIHRDLRFLLLTATGGGATRALTCALGRSDPSWLDTLPDHAADDVPEARPVTLSRALLDTLDPERLAIPWLTCGEDLGVLAAASSVAPALADPAGWNVRFGRELNATDDRPHFVPRGADSQGCLIVEGKHLQPFRVDLEAATQVVSRARARTLVDEAATFGRWRLGYRDVASATNRLTLIAALLPPGTISTHTIFCARAPLGGAAQHCLSGLLNSLVANYLVRLQVTTHVSATLMARLPVPRPAARSIEFRQLAALARLLSHHGMDDRSDAYACLNAIVARLYRLTPSQYTHVVESFPLLSIDLRRRCLAAFDALTNGAGKAS